MKKQHTLVWQLYQAKKSVHSWDSCFKNCQTSVVMEWGGKTWGNGRTNYILTIRG